MDLWIHPTRIVITPAEHRPATEGKHNEYWAQTIQIWEDGRKSTLCITMMFESQGTILAPQDTKPAEVLLEAEA